MDGRTNPIPLTADVTAMQAAIADFTGVEHRLEFVREREGVKWYNDSIASAPERVLAALKSFDEPLVVLELKFTWSFPRWMQDLVERFDLDRASFSKYSRALDQAMWEPLDCDPAGFRSVLG